MARSYLFIPGNVPRMLQNMDVFDADVIIIDFEDAIANDEKDEARFLTREFLRAHRPKDLEILIRINSDDEATMKKDLAALKTLDISGIVLPKTTSVQLDKFSSLMQPNQTSWAVYGLIETPEAFFELDKIAKHALIKGLMLGGEDLSTLTHIDKAFDEMAFYMPKSLLNFAAKAAGKVAIDTPEASLDETKLNEALKRTKTFGFDGKLAIHPNQVPTINQRLSPSQNAINAAKRIVIAHEKHGSMRFSLDGKMVDKPIIERAKKLLKQAKDYNLLGGDDNAL